MKTNSKHNISSADLRKMLHSLNELNQEEREGILTLIDQLHRRKALKIKTNVVELHQALTKAKT